MPFVPRLERSSPTWLSLGSRRILLGSLLLTLLLAAPTIYGGPVGGPFSIASPPPFAPHAAPFPSAAPASTAPLSPAPHPVLSLGLGLLGLPGTASTTAMAFDAKDGYTLLLAPNTSSGATAASSSESYAYLGGDWVRLHPTVAPSSREYASMTYDARLGKIVLFGGYTASGGFLGDTWEFSGGSWTDVSGLSNQTPSARSAAALAFDPSGGFDLLFGGYGSLGSALFGNLTDTWEFQGGNWTTVTSSAVPPIEGSMAYDANLSEMIYYGGVGLLGLCTRSTFAFSGGQWSDISSTIAGAPAGLAMTSMAYDAAQNRLLLFGGACGLGVAGIGLTLATSNSTYALSGGAWTRLSVAGAPAPRFGVDLAYDARLGSTLLFGGENATLLVLGSERFTLLGGTFEFSGSAWSKVGPALRSPHPVAETGLPLGIRAVGLIAADASQFAYIGTPSGCLATGATVNCTASAAGSLKIGVTITSRLGFSSATSVNESAALNLTVVPRLQVVSLNVSRAQTEVGVPVRFSAVVGGGFGAVTAAFVGLPSGCGSQNTTRLNCTPIASGSYSVGFQALDAIGVQANAAVALTVAGRLTIQSFTLSHPVLDLGMSTSAAVEMTGGVGLYSVAFPTLPSGCRSQNTTTLDCTPNGTGAYTMGLRVTDGLGVGTQLNQTVQVNPDPAIARFDLSGLALVAGSAGRLSIGLNVTGGTGPFVVNFSGLPPGCSVVNASFLGCPSTTAGTYHVRVTATDSLGWSASAEANLTVAVAPPGTGGPGPKGSGPISDAPFLEGFAASAVLFALVASALLARSSARRRESERLARELEEGTASAPPDLLESR